ncbi:hypothetical protein [Bifidobacterium mongoliense]|uniref:hypothetical protein n=1 Tax=Bifidobacterium mongoliense TaxID=518643 RepID=UPI0030EB7C38
MGRLRTVLGWVGVVGFVMPLIPFSDPQVRTSLRVSVWQQPMMPLPGMVITPQTLLTIAGLALGALCWLVYGILRMLAGRRRDEQDGHHAAAGRLRKVLCILTRVIVALAVLWGVLTAGFALLFVDGYHVLAPRSAAGCAVVVSYSESLFNSAGNVYIKQPGSSQLVDTGGNWSQVQYVFADPINSGTWSLTWQGRSAHLNIWGHDSRTEFHAAPHEITCDQ